MSTKTLVVRAELQKFALCRAMGDADLWRLASISCVRDIVEGELLFCEGEPAENVYLVLRGEVRLTVGDPHAGARNLIAVGPGELLGWSALLERSPAAATAQAYVPTQAIVFPGADLLALCLGKPIIAHYFLRGAARTAADRLLTTRLDLLERRRERLPEPTMRQEARSQTAPSAFP